MPHYFFVKDSLVDKYLLGLTKLQYNVTMYDRDKIKRECYNEIVTVLIKEGLGIITSFTSLLLFGLAFLLLKYYRKLIHWRNNWEFIRL